MEKESVKDQWMSLMGHVSLMQRRGDEERREGEETRGEMERK